VGKPAPDFQLPNLEGQPISLSDFRGKPVLLNFWATWCGPCVFEMPFIQSIFEESSDTGLVILAVNIGEAPPTVRDFIQSGNFSFPVLLDTSQDVALEYNVRGIPTTFLIDKNGIIQVIKVGAFSSMLEIKRSLSKIIP
jgi:peroxiredoxin